jgi:hypothetical protein
LIHSRPLNNAPPAKRQAQLQFPPASQILS